jgi:hypothetical protein
VSTKVINMQCATPLPSAIQNVSATLANCTASATSPLFYRQLGLRRGESVVAIPDVKVAPSARKRLVRDRLLSGSRNKVTPAEGMIPKAKISKVRDPSSALAPARQVRPTTQGTLFPVWRSLFQSLTRPPAEPQIN